MDSIPVVTMARTVKPLTNTQIKHAKPQAKEYSLADGAGLYLRIKPTGEKYWIFNYQRPAIKTRTNIGFGAFPDTSLAIAREKRAGARTLLHQGLDPKAHREQQTTQAQQAAANTLEKIAKDWLEVKRSKVSQDHADDIWRSLELHVFPYIGKQALNEITAPLVIQVLKPVANKGNLETIKRLCQRLNEIMIFAVNTGLRDGANPIAGIKDAFQQPEKKHLPSIDPDQLPELVSRIHLASLRTTTRLLLLWQLHSMVRPSEAAGTEWREIDRENCLWTIHAERMKKKKQHSVPLTVEMLKILDAMQDISGHRLHVFPSEINPRNATNAQTANMALKRMGYEGVLVAHGLRSLASTTLNEQGFAADIIESALAHSDKNEVRAAYNRAQYLDQRREMMTWWSKRIAQDNHAI